jgi:hypothetical protein
VWPRDHIRSRACFRDLPAQEVQELLQRVERVALAGPDVLDLAVPADRRRLVDDAVLTPEADEEGVQP